jgi:3-dehydro-L-gulonate 2-dehydrogenase
MLVPYKELEQELNRVLIKSGMKEEKAQLCAEIFAGNSRDGVYSHGLNRFPLFIQSIGEGSINVNAEPEVVSIKGSIENWDGHLAPGMYTATKAVSRAVELAGGNGIGLVAVKNTNHWMRGGTLWLAGSR